MVIYSQISWLIVAVLGIVGLLAWKGRLDPILKPFIIVLVLACMGIAALIGFVECWPERVRQQHGDRAYERMFGNRFTFSR